MNEFQQNRAIIEEFLSFIHPLPSLIELRAFAAGGGILSGTFADSRALARNAAALDAKGLVTGAYFTLNSPSAESLKDKTKINKIMRSPKYATRDKDVRHRALYLIDVDPVRPSGVSATEGEKAEAHEVLTEIQQYLAALDWPEPIFIDSGNGYHLLYKGDGCGAVSRPWIHVLKHLDRKFSTESAKVDTSVGNPARISRLPGTWNRKGENTRERPHRQARVLSYPDVLTALGHGLIFRLASDTGYESEFDRSSQYDNREKPKVLIDAGGVHKLIEEFPDQLRLGYDARREEGHYFFLAECPFNGGAHRNQINKTAIILRDESIGFKCFSDECHDRKFSDLIKLLKRETGRSPSMPIWKTSSRIEGWMFGVWGMEIPGSEEAEAEYLAEAISRQQQLPEFQYDLATYTTMYSAEFKEQAAEPDPELWGVTDLVLNRFVELALDEVRVLKGEAKIQRYRELQAVRHDDVKTMGTYLGRQQLFYLSRLADRPLDGSPDWKRREVEDVFEFIMGVGAEDTALCRA